MWKVPLYKGLYLCGRYLYIRGYILCGKYLYIRGYIYVEGAFI